MKWRLIALAVLLFVLIVAAILLPVPEPEPRYIEDVMYNVKHDGYEFIVIYDQNGVAIIRHPDCEAKNE